MNEPVDYISNEDHGDVQPEAPGPNLTAVYAAGARLGAAMEEAAQRVAAMQAGMLAGLQRSALQSSDDETDEDHGDETDAAPTGPPQFGPWMGRFDATVAAYWQAQAVQADADRDAALALVESALAVAQHWPVRVGGTITGGLYAALRALDGEARAYRARVAVNEPMPLDQALRAVQQVAAQHRDPESE